MDFFSNTDRQTAPPVEVPPVLKNNCGINEEESGNNLYESISWFDKVCLLEGIVQSVLKLQFLWLILHQHSWCDPSNQKTEDSDSDLQRYDRYKEDTWTQPEHLWPGAED